MSTDGQPQNDYPPAPPQAQNIVIVGTNFPMLGDFPTQVTCSQCHQHVLTNVRYVEGVLVWILVLILCVLFCPLMCVPCCIDQCKDVEHYCPSCKALIGVKKRL